MNDIILDAKGLSKTYRTGPDEVVVWENVDLKVNIGETISIIGASGSGKSTLLNALGGLDSIDSGEVVLAGHKIHSLAEVARTQLRNRDLGFVYQFHHLLPEFSALENVMMPLLIRGDKAKVARAKALTCLDQVGLSQRSEHKPSELSGGERQRVAIARALVGQPKVVLLDEPTGNLDQQTAEQVEDVLLALSETVGMAFVIVTHDEALAGRANRRYKLSDRTLVEMRKPK
ncbi:MAG: ABC transporter ATP-binding protein [Oleispira antarctica]|uniref:Lipoprotein-releasing system ATP-binding protein LolD n=1 Tax=Oleispira antarctica RB-8 TaxID=698738 RepID=R4YMW6_OLEAN|nr:ABC transporter ATP-binding protein [Oleispira antarctica]CCK76247.1 Lipoprotein-releasing system ATP-binding protein LolD [Oleispira antarctica RB-8]